MPKSRGRQAKTSRTPRRGRPLATAEQRARDIAELPVLQAADRAEASGEPGATLELIERDLGDREDENFWRPERIRRLLQLELFGPLLPRWATSRWILEQAAQSLDRRGRHRSLRALEIAVETRGGEETLVGTDELDARAKVIDHDWVFRQLLLYEFGALQDFVARVASPELVSGADRIHEWARTRMGGFRFVGESPRTLAWQDLALQAEVVSLNLGAASLLEPGECVLGRLVPIDGGAMFETAPLFVPDDVARQVAEDPADWVAAVSAECRRVRAVGIGISTSGNDFQLLTDVPSWVQQAVAHASHARTAARSARPSVSPTDVAEQAALVRAALDEELVDFVVSPWPTVAASLLEPRVFRRYAQASRPPTDRDSPVWRTCSPRPRVRSAERLPWMWSGQPDHPSRGGSRC